ncbi:hypothetical protein N480_05290 [Pseudoalteromonas luteoviolacea S2607]|uniref:tryptophan halogenase family protein n=1 Tax=Pseudoalteromonas luteoviolacea TaxID=43657 RepID=UPI0007B09885|nr:tryptophan halogenase family protein [Pseudoalteromonas luteoviolacea]KZN30366.1 hypothetical protein N480_05290 [Pseudoalteromonas luteoviolacea S2607]
MIKKIVIVGGGTAGWLAANHLAKKLQPYNTSQVEVTLVESPDIPTIGVGEGTVPMMRSTLQYLGISETQFIRECDVTFKQGIKFVNWLNNPDVKQHAYYHPFDYPFLEKFDLSAYYLLGAFEDFNSYSELVGFQSHVCNANLAPKSITHTEFQGISNYAYHLDAGKFSNMLQKHATEVLGVNYISATMKQANVGANGEITSIETLEAGEIEGDFFLDCTGFSAKLSSGVLNVPFVDKKDTLFVDSALAIQVPYGKENESIPSYTLSTAQKNGWIWDIGLTSRRGIGHVYSSSHTSDEQALRDLSDYLKMPDEQVDARKISMKIGYREEAWTKNCVAMGLAQGFVEPLEATGLLVFDITARMLAEQFTFEHKAMEANAKAFNRRVSHMWDKVIDFIKLHYCISKRSDSQFWLDNRCKSSIPESLQEKLTLWRYQIPKAYDFSSTLEVFNLENYLYVLYGMEFDTDISALSCIYQQKELARKEVAEIVRYAQSLEKQLEPNRTLLEKINQFGLSKV